jgi:hypothetical protein
VVYTGESMLVLGSEEEEEEEECVSIKTNGVQ